METLTDTVVREAQGCEAVALAWVAGDFGFILQTRVRSKRTDAGKGWIMIAPAYATAAEYRQAEEAVAKIRKLHPDAWPTLVNYGMRPGGLFVEVFRRV